MKNNFKVWFIFIYIILSTTLFSSSLEVKKVILDKDIAHQMQSDYGAKVLFKEDYLKLSIPYDVVFGDS
ncbi:MAG: hypothetical protein GY817_08250 [bacterium]|nr:hypothetical protein [bacterium]